MNWNRWNAQLKTLAFLGGLSALLVAAGGALGPGWLYGALALAFAMNGFAYFFSDRMVLRMHGAQPVDERQAPELHAIVAEMARAAGIPKPRVFRVDDPQPNAFATGRNPEHGVVAVTTGLVELLDRREVRGVLAHEIAHIRNRDTLIATVAAGLAAAISYLAQMVQFSLFFGGSSSEDEEHGSALGGLVVAFVAPLAATLVQLAVSRSRELLADETAARISGDPLALASALERLEAGAAAIPATAAAHPATASLFIVNPLAGGSVAGLFSTHPPAAQRIERLRGFAREFQRAG